MKIKIATYFGFDMTIDIPDEQYKDGDDKWYQDKFIEIRQKDIESACKKQRINDMRDVKDFLDGMACASSLEFKAGYNRAIKDAKDRLTHLIKSK